MGEKAGQIKSDRKKKFHYAWVIAIASMLLAGAGTGIFSSTLGVFVKPICDKYGFGRAEFTLYSSIFYIVNVIMMPIYGNLFQKFGFRKVALTGSLVLSSCLIGYSFSSQLWMFYLFGLVSGLFINGISIMAIGILINNWFIDHRGLASGIAFSGSGITASILLPICSRLIENFGTTYTYRILAIIDLLITLPIILLIIKDKPEDIGLRPLQDEMVRSNETKEKTVVREEGGVTRIQAMKTPVFWLLFLSITGIAICQASPNSNTISILEDIGYQASYAARISSAYMIMLTICKILIGQVFDKLGSLKGSLIIGLCCVIFPVIALFNTVSPVVPWMYIAFLAVAGSGSTVLGNVLTSNYFGRKDYSKIYSIIAMGTQLGAALSSPFFGYVFDTTGGYNAAWIMIAVLGAIVCIFLYTSYKSAQVIKKKYNY